MRPVIKGTAPRSYSHWKHARNDLGNQIGWHCSYCEMAITNMIEVEHIVPRHRGGKPFDWDNFLLSCKYCNTVKSDRNPSSAGYLWPDRDNTDISFTYSLLNVIEHVNGRAQAEAIATIDLMGLNRRPGGHTEPTEADTRWIFRLQAWVIAKKSYRNWQSAPSVAMANQIALTALGTGFYSIWTTVFKSEVQVLQALQSTFPNTYKAMAGGVRVVRANGVI
ncbi:MAG: HNH endonuclease [Chitinophagaceae bacterium]|nr:MAG: HNH endonuclease [Chitinophagaceae bacterium]